MGTKIQANAFFPEYHSVIDLNGSTSNGMIRTDFHEDPIHRIGPFAAQIRRNGYLGYDIEKVRQTILEHESVFKNQLQELHRLYGRQRELMNEIKKDELKDKCLPVLLPPQEPRSLRSFEHRLFTSSICSKGTVNISTSNKNTASYDRDTKLSLSAVQTSQRNSNALEFDLCFKRTNRNDRISDDLTLSRGESSSNPCPGFNLVMKDFFQTSASGKEHLSEDYTVNFAEKMRFDKPLAASPQSLLAEPRKELSHCPYTGTSVSRKKKKIFGVEISEGDEYPFNTDSNKYSSTLDPKIEPHVLFKTSSWVSNSCMRSLNLGGTNVKNDGKNEKSTADLKGEISSQKEFSSTGLNFGNVSFLSTESGPHKNSKNSVDMNPKPADFQYNQEKPKNVLPWFLKTAQASVDMSKTKKSSYFMNLDSLQNYSENFFRKAEIAEGKLEKIMGEDESARKVEKDDNVQTNQADDKEFVSHDKGLCNGKANLRHHIDLNLSLGEDDALSAPPSLPTDILKIATAEIDLEAPPLIESEVSYDECDKIAAEAMIDISSSAKKNSADDKSCDDRLKWLADIISTDQSEPHGDIEPIPDGMDHFEFMTLKLENIKEEQHNHKPFSSQNPKSEGENGGARLSKRSRRWRQRRDFQRETLPGLVTLSRLEVKEDFQAFEELLKAEGPSQQGPARNGRGRKRLGSRNASPVAKVVRSGRAQRAICQLEERSLTGWGKRTRRLPRQRYANGFLAFPVKC